MHVKSSALYFMLHFCFGWGQNEIIGSQVNYCNETNKIYCWKENLPLRFIENAFFPTQSEGQIMSIENMLKLTFRKHTKFIIIELWLLWWYFVSMFHSEYVLPPFHVNFRKLCCFQIQSWFFFHLLQIKVLTCGISHTVFHRQFATPILASLCC